MANDIIEVKPAIAPGIHLNINALMRSLSLRERSNSVYRVGYRFLELFADHSVAITQIQHFLPDITLDKLVTPDAMLGTLTDDVLNRTAELFRIRRSWLDGADDRRYDGDWCYKHPSRFFACLREIQMKENWAPIRALHASKTLDVRNPSSQPIALVLLEKINDLGDETIFRYRPFRDSWDWSYKPSRIQLKAMIRLSAAVWNISIPLYRVKRSVINDIWNGGRIQSSSFCGAIQTDPALEDYAYSIEEYSTAKEVEELDMILEYIDMHNLI